MTSTWSDFAIGRIVFVRAEASTELQVPQQSEADKTALQSFLYPDAEELSNSEMPIWDHLDELRERLLIAGLAAGGAILTCFCFSKDLVVFLEAPVAEQGVRFLQLSPGEFFFTTFKVFSSHLARLLFRLSVRFI